LRGGTGQQERGGREQNEEQNGTTRAWLLRDIQPVTQGIASRSVRVSGVTDVVSEPPRGRRMLAKEE